MIVRALVAAVAAGVPALAGVPAVGGVPALSGGRPALAGTAVAASGTSGATAGPTSTPQQPTAGAVRVVTLQDPRLTESSGLVLSPTHAGLAWTVNDSGSGPVVYGVSTVTGRTRAVLRLRGIELRDAEAMTATTAPSGRGLLWIGDVGDNAEVRDSVVLRLVREPRTVASTAVTPVSLRVRYPGGPADAESLVWTPDGRLLIATKELLSAQVLQVPPSAVRAALRGRSTDHPVTARRLATVAQGLVTDGAALPDGRIVLRGYGDAVVYAAPAGGQMVALDEVPLPSQPQGETLAVEPGGRSALVGSEGVRQPLWRVRLPAPPAPAPGSRTATSPAAPASARGEDTARSVPDHWWLAGAGAAVVAALALTGATRRSRRSR